MNVIIASDHAGLDYKEKIILHLQKKGFIVEDFGPYTADSFDYPDSAHKVAESVAQNPEKFGILICGTGLGMSIAANRHSNIRASLCTSEFQARATRGHNNANILCLGSRVTGENVALAIVDAFFESDFEGGRHQRRIEKIELDYKG